MGVSGGPASASAAAAAAGGDRGAQAEMSSGYRLEPPSQACMRNNDSLSLAPNPWQSNGQ